MSSGVYVWSQTAAANGAADSTVNWSEGQAPSTINDSARAMMAGLAKYRDDTAGNNNTTGGTSTAYTLSSNQIFDSTAHMAGQEFTVYFHVTNGASPTLNIDGLAAFAIVTDSAGTAIPSGTLIAGAPYEFTCVPGSSQFRLKNFYVVPYVMPIGAVMEYYGSSVPNANFAFPNGQAISRTTYSTLFALLATTYGAGDGSTTFNLPDLTGRVTAMKEASATRLTSTYFGGNSTNLGAVGGGESKTLVTGNLPPYTPSGSVSITGISLNSRTANTSGSNDTGSVSASTFTGTLLGAISAFFASGSATFSGSAQGGTSTPVAIVQPTIICNKIMRII